MIDKKQLQLPSKVSLVDINTKKTDQKTGFFTFQMSIDEPLKLRKGIKSWRHMFQCGTFQACGDD